MSRKVRMLGLIILSVSLITSCGGESASGANKLYCTDTNDRLTEELTFTFKDDKVSSVKAVYTSKQDSKEDAEANVDNMKTFINLGYGSSEDGKNYTLDVKTKGNDVIATMDIDYEKASDTIKEALGTGSKEEIKEAMESNGSTCK